MHSSKTTRLDQQLLAYVLPFGVFIGFFALVSLCKSIGGAFWLSAPAYWIYPLQTLTCGGLLLWFRRYYPLQHPRNLLLVIAVGVGVFLLWISPQAFLGFAARTDGFNPSQFADNPALYWTTVLFRFLRLVVVVPLVEEIFWRGFLLRYFIDEKFDRVPFGTFSWFSFGVVTLGFMLAHSPADYAAAAITGALYNFVAYRTRSLISCVLVHALTNLLLGLWIMQTRQWGFW